MNSKYAEANIKKLSSRDHVLARPNLYLGAIDKAESEEFVLEEGKLLKKKLSYVPALIKIINEILDNSIDEAVRTNFEFANKIKIDVTNTSVTVEDNGRGIPVKKIKDTDHYMPVAAFCQARTGSNFEDDENRTSIGMNGVGSFATNVFSKIFNVDTSDGIHRLSLRCSNNLKNEEFSIHKNSKQFTKVYFEPDLSRFKVDKIDKAHVDVLYQRVLFLSISYPDIKFYFNGERVNIGTEKAFLSMFSDTFEILSGENWFVGVFPNEEDDFSYFTYVNGLYIKSGGNHVNLISNEIVNRVREKLAKKYKSLKPGDVRNKLSLVIFFQNFKNMKFNSQTKETLTNSTSEIRDYMSISVDDWDNFGKKILKNTDLIEPIIEMFRIKEEYKKRQELKKLSSNKKKIQNDKYYPPIGEKKYLLLSEGDCLSENTEISIVRNKEKRIVSLKEVQIGDYVFTHKHRLRRIENKSYKLEKKTTIITKSGKSVSSSENHRFLVYSNEKFFFKSVKDINLSDKLISSKYTDILLTRIVDILKIHEDNYQLEFILDQGCMKMSNNHVCVVFDKITSELYTREAQDIKKEDILCLIED